MSYFTAVQFVDGITPTIFGTVKPASTAAIATDTALVVALSPNNVPNIQGDSASGAAKAGNPIQIGGVFNTAQPTVTTGQTVETQATARGALIVATGVDAFQIQGVAAADAVASGNPVLIGGVDAAGNIQEFSISDAGATAGVQVLQVGGTDGTLARALSTDTSGRAIIVPLNTAGSIADADANSQNIWQTNLGAPIRIYIRPQVFNGTTWDILRSTNIGNNVTAMGILAATSYGQYNTVAPTTTSGNYSSLQTDYAGGLFVKPIRRSQTVAQATTIASSGAATPILAAQAAGIFADISNLVITVTPLAGAVADTNFTATLSDGTNNYVFDLDTGHTGSATVAGSDSLGVNVNFNPPLSATTAATAWQITLSSATVTVHITTVAVLQKAS